MPDSETPDEPENSRRPVQPISVVRQGMRVLLRQFLALLGLVHIMVGIPLAMLTPFPFVPIGVPVVIIGVVLLGRNSVWGRRWMERILDRWPDIEKFAPHWLMKLVFGRDKRSPEELARLRG